jgi:3-oxoacyl-[acyl-carrier-protein] synthase-1
MVSTKTTAMLPQVLVAGIGARTAMGDTLPATVAAYRARLANFAEHPWLVTEALEPVLVARVPTLQIEMPLEDRLVELAVSAISEAMTPLAQKLQPLNPRTRLHLGLPPSRAGLSEGYDQRVVNALLKHPALAPLRPSYQHHMSGHASALRAMEGAYEEIVKGAADVAMVVGADSYLAPETLLRLDADRQLHSVGQSWGFIPGEAAACCVLMSNSFAKTSGAPLLGEVVRVASAEEKNRIKTKTVCTGDGLSAAYRGALEALPRDLLVDHLYCDLNGEPYRADEFGFAVVRHSQRFRNAGEFRAPADSWGDVGAASGLLLAALALAPSKRPGPPAQHILLSTSSEQGDRCAALLRTPAG